MQNDDVVIINVRSPVRSNVRFSVRSHVKQYEVRFKRAKKGV